MFYRQNLFRPRYAISFGWRDVYVDGATLEPTNNSGGKMEKRGCCRDTVAAYPRIPEVDLPAGEPCNGGVSNCSLAFSRNLSIIDIDLKRFKRSERRLHGIVAKTMPCFGVCGVVNDRADSGGPMLRLMHKVASRNVVQQSGLLGICSSYLLNMSPCAQSVYAIRAVSRQYGRHSGNGI